MEEGTLQLIINYWVLQTLAMLLTGLLIPGLKVSGPLGAFAAVLGLAFVNATLWDAALFFSIPESFTTQALLLFLCNGALFWIFIKLMPGIEVEGVLPALAAPVVFTFCSLMISQYGNLIDWGAILDVVVELISSIKEYFYESGVVGDGTVVSDNSPG